MRPIRRYLMVPLVVLLALMNLPFPVVGIGTTLAAGCVVTTTAEGTAPVPAGSLREKLADNTCTVITFQAGVTGTITLVADLPTVTHTVGVAGPGASSLTIDRDDSSGVAFQIEAGGDLTVSGLTVTGAASGVSVSAGNATLSNLVLSGNFYGLFVYLAGTATVSASTFSANVISGINLIGGSQATVAGSTLSGGSRGLNVQGGSAEVTNSTFAANQFGVNLYQQGDSVTLTNSTIYGTSPTGNSILFAITNDQTGIVTLRNTLLVQTQAQQNCQISGFAGPFPIINDTHNLANDATCFANGANGSVVVAQNATIVDAAGLADNGGPTKTIALAANSPAIDAGYPNVCTAAPVSGVDQRGNSRTVGAGASCDIGAFEVASATAATITLNGGTLTQTYDGTPRAVTATTTPAGLSYSVTYNGSNIPPTAAGSYPVVATVTAPGYTSTPATGTLVVARAATCVVTTLADSGAGSLREKLPNCNAITLSVTGTIALLSDLPTVAHTVSVTGPGAGSLTVNRGNTNSPAAAFPVGAGGRLTLSGLTVTGAYVGIHLMVDVNGQLSDGNLTLTNAVLSGNSLAGLYFGGGGTATLTNTTVSGNSQYGLFFNAGGTATLATSTVSGNSLAGLYLIGGSTATLTNATVSSNGDSGLAIGNGSAATLTNTTVSGNSHVSLVLSPGGTATLTNTLLAKGSVANCSFSDGGTLNNVKNNLADDASCFADNSGASNASHVVSTAQLGLDPAGLADNGGPTQTIALLPTSAAINAGDNAVCTTTPVNSVDQRGIVRPNGPQCDIGAYEFEGPLAQSIAFAAPGGKTYGDAPFTIGATAVQTANNTPTGLLVTFTSQTTNICTVGSSTLAGNLSQATVTIIGAGDCTIKATQGGSPSYAPATPVSRTFAIAKKSLTVTAGAAHRPYGSTTVPCTVTFGGFVNGDGPSVVSGSATCTTTATASSPAGSTHPLTPVIGSLTAANYAFGPFVAGTLTIDKMTTALTSVALNGTYGSAMGTLTATLTRTHDNAPIAGATVAFTVNGVAACGVAGKPTCPVTNAQGIAIISGQVVPKREAGNYNDIVVVARFAGNASYEPSVGQGRLTIARAILYVKPTDRTVGLRQPNSPTTPPAGCAPTGCWLELANGSQFANGDTWAALNFTNLRFQYSRNPPSTNATEQIGSTYRITALGATSANYDIRYLPGTLTVK